MKQLRLSNMMEAFIYIIPLLIMIVVAYYSEPLTIWAEKHGLLNKGFNMTIKYQRNNKVCTIHTNNQAVFELLALLNYKVLSVK